MAICKFSASKSPVKGILQYITRDDKTEARLVSGKDCMAENAEMEFQTVKKLFGKTEGRQYYHIVQSFHPDDPVDFYTAHQIGLQFAAYFAGYQCVVATHKDRNHIHNHIVLNSVNHQTGRMFHQTKQEMELAKEYSNQLCLQYGLSVTETKASRDQKRWPEWKKRLRKAALYAMKHSYDREDFIRLMGCVGYGVKWEDRYKYITFTTPEGQVCRNNKLFDERLLKENLERYFALGGAAAYEREAYQNYRPERENAPVGGLARLLDCFLGAQEVSYHQEHVHHSERELERMRARGQKISHAEVVNVLDEDDEYEQQHGFSLLM